MRKSKGLQKKKSKKAKYKQKIHTISKESIKFFKFLNITSQKKSKRKIFKNVN